VDLFAWLVLAFGLGYALGGRDLPRFWPYIAMGSLGKAGVAALALLGLAWTRRRSAPATA